MIDYSEVYYVTIRTEEMPTNRAGKFVQIRNEHMERECVVLSPKDLSLYHAHIVERFCRQNGQIEGEFNEKKDFFRISDAAWEVVGGGIWSIDSIKKVLNLSGASQGYGKFDPHGLKQKILSLEKMAGYTVRIDGM